MLGLRIEATPSADAELRQEIWLLFGNVGRGLVSMFELTLANYAAITRSMMENVSPWFAAATLELAQGFDPMICVSHVPWAMGQQSGEPCRSGFLHTSWWSDLLF